MNQLKIIENDPALGVVPINSENQYFIDLINRIKEKGNISLECTDTLHALRVRTRINRVRKHISFPFIVKQRQLKIFVIRSSSTNNQQVE